jgi:CO/xanthine dehydrogenase FAD-binding subunit
MPVLLPQQLEEALSMLEKHGGDLVPMAGATDLLVFWPARVERHDALYMDLSKLRGLRQIRWRDGSLELGAMTTYWDMLQDRGASAEFPMLQEAARQVGAIQIQARGTWAGNIANASPAADGVPALMACDATVVLRSSRGIVEVPLEEFYQGYKQISRRPDELITAIRVPRHRHVFQAFHKVAARRAQAITKVGLAIARSDAGWRVVANSVAPTVRRCRNIEQMLERMTPVASPDDLMDAIEKDISPIDDIRSAAEYRRRVMANVLYHALRGVCESFS